MTDGELQCSACKSPIELGAGIEKVPRAGIVNPPGSDEDSPNLGAAKIGSMSELGKSVGFVEIKEEEFKRAGDRCAEFEGIAGALVAVGVYEAGTWRSVRGLK